ncbi:MAG: hypothetical protein KGL52_16590 [Rhodospirillales bacterium]|nr:hypothetical protein [Rhodospirillales bacterium]
MKPAAQPGLPLRELAATPEPVRKPVPPGPRARAIHVSGYPREARDFYATPPWVTEALLRHVSLRGPVWEPCCGDGAMARVLTAHGHQVVASDIADRGFGTPGVDFLAAGAVPGGCRAIVTNPPYGEGAGAQPGHPRSPTAMLEFLRHALALTSSVQGQLALLVRLQWIAGQRAAAIMSTAPFAAVIALRERIRWFDLGAHTNQAQHHHAWVVFDHAHPHGRPPAFLFG